MQEMGIEVGKLAWPAVDFPEIHGGEGYEDEIDDEYEGDWNNSSSHTSGAGGPSSGKEKSWLYTLDPILITIIAMSSLGVLLGATCAGLLLYCTCSYSGLSSRSCTTLENYNFELYDGLKHKGPHSNFGAHSRQQLIGQDPERRDKEISPKRKRSLLNLI
ncbi:hypothetical protein STEG23_032118, partial [Scotinomys teguina]